MAAVQGNRTGHTPVGQDDGKTAPQQLSMGDRRSVGPSRPVPCRVSTLRRSPIWSGFLLFVAAILTAPSARSVFDNTQWAEGSGGLGIGVLAEPCEGPQNITVSKIEPNISSLFACEGGEFNVSWSGVIQVSSTITIGRWTTVRIFGESPKHSSSSVSSSMTLASTSASNTDGISLNGSSGRDSSSSGYGLNVPQELTSAVVRANMSDPFGPIFSVLDGELHLESVAIRGGNATTYSTSKAITKGGGVYAYNSNVSIFGCIFEENFAESHGGGIQTNWSTLIVTDSVFRGNHAGFQSIVDEKDADGDGGGLGVSALL